MPRSLISNPPFNIRWNPPMPLICNLQPRFREYGIPPKNNANYAFILTALEEIDLKAAFILPNNVLNSKNLDEINIRKSLIEKNLISAVIMLPDKMFESTSIATCILLFDKNKQTTHIEMIDMRHEFVEVNREQKGQYGGNSHENRTYYKTIKVINYSQMQKAISAINEQKSVSGYSKSVSINQIRKKDYVICPSLYIDLEFESLKHRDWADIARDYNRIIDSKNALKITVNEKLAKELGLYDIFLNMTKGSDVSKSFEIVGESIKKEAFLTISKNAAEFKIENKSNKNFPEILSIFLSMWKQHIMYLNNEENRLLAEFRDALIPELLSGNIEATK